MVPPPGYKPSKKTAKPTDDKPSLWHVAVKGGLVVAGLWGVAAIIGSIGHATNGMSGASREAREWIPKRKEKEEITIEELEFMEEYERQHKSRRCGEG